MRAHVLVTDGKRTVDLFWVEHDGKDVYCGHPKFDGKRSYHESGKIHSTRNGRKEDEAWVTPLKDLKKTFNLTSINIGNAHSYVTTAAPRYEYSGRKSDAVLLIDTRAIPEDVQTNILIGLVEPGNGKSLAWLLSLQLPFEDEEFLPQQAVLATSVKPWVYAVVYWWRKKPANRLLNTDARKERARAG